MQNEDLAWIFPLRTVMIKPLPSLLAILPSHPFLSLSSPPIYFFPLNNESIYFPQQRNVLTLEQVYLFIDFWVWSLLSIGYMSLRKRLLDVDQAVLQIQGNLSKRAGRGQGVSFVVHCLTDVCVSVYGHDSLSEILETKEYLQG